MAQESDHFTKKNSIQKKLVPNTPSTEIGVFGGVSYYNGEVNPASQFNPTFMDWAAGAIVRRNINSRWAIRLNGMYGNVKGNQLTNTNQSINGVTFESKIYELSGMAEFNFFPYCVANDIIYFTPYLFGGLGGFRFNPVSTESANTSLANTNPEGVAYSNFSIALPFGFGLKAKFSNRFLIGAEWGVRKTWTDYLDDVSTSYLSTNRQRGNSKNKDYYSFAGLTLTVRLGPKITTCHFQ